MLLLIYVENDIKYLLIFKINFKKSLTEGADMSAKLSVSFPT